MSRWRGRELRLQRIRRRACRWNCIPQDQHRRAFVLRRAAPGADDAAQGDDFAELYSADDLGEEILSQQTIRDGK